MYDKFELFKYPALANEKRKELVSDISDKAILEFKSFIVDLVNKKCSYDVIFNIMKNSSLNYYNQQYSLAFNEVLCSFYFKDKNLDLFHYIVNKDNRPFDRLIDVVYFHLIHQCGAVEVLDKIKAISKNSFKPYFQCLQDLLQKYSSQSQALKSMLILDNLSFEEKCNFITYILLEGTYISKSSIVHLLSDLNVRQALINNLSDSNSQIHYGIMSGTRTYYILSQNSFIEILIDMYESSQAVTDFVYSECLMKKDAFLMYKFAKIFPRKVLDDLFSLNESDLANDLIRSFSTHPDIKIFAMLQ